MDTVASLVPWPLLGPDLNFNVLALSRRSLVASSARLREILFTIWMLYYEYYDCCSYCSSCFTT